MNTITKDYTQASSINNILFNKGDNTNKGIIKRFRYNPPRETVIAETEKGWTSINELKHI